MSNNFLKQPSGFATKAIHVGQEPEQWNSMCVIPPMCLSSTFQQDAPGQYRTYVYSRSGNPTRTVLEKCLASLDNGKYGLTFASGLGAETTAFSLLSAGDHIIIGDDVYGGTNRLLRQVITRLGIDATFVDPTDIKKLEDAILPTTKMAWIETPTNPLIKIADIAKISTLFHSKGNIIVVIDNTFLTSYFQRPLDLGADIVMYSLTKYMNGHTDVVMGAMVTNNDDLYKRLKFLQNSMGIVPSPFDCYQVNRSLKTLAIRMEQHMKNGIEVAKFLESHEFVDKVLHPALKSHPQHELALKQTYGYSGTFSFYIKGELKHAQEFFKHLKLFILAESLGGFESLAEIPSIMTHSSVPAEDRKVLGITDTLIRLSVGIEDVNDLIDDLKTALNAAQKL